MVFLAPLLRRLFLWWQEAVNGFVLAETPPSRADVRVSLHPLRRGHPLLRQLCVAAGNVPRLSPCPTLRSRSPAMLAGCGYRPVARNAARVLRVLQDQPLTDEQRARLSRELHLQ